MNKTEADLYKYVEKCLKEHNLDYTKDGDYFNVNTRHNSYREDYLEKLWDNNSAILEADKMICRMLGL